MLNHLPLWALLLSLGLAGCSVNSDADCQTLCAWWKQTCTAESLDSCLSDCRDTTESAQEGITRCVEGQGWGTPSTCRSASCCVRFVYWEEQYRQQCL